MEGQPREYGIRGRIGEKMAALGAVALVLSVDFSVCTGSAREDLAVAGGVSVVTGVTLAIAEMMKRTRHDNDTPPPGAQELPPSEATIISLPVAPNTIPERKAA